MLLIVRKEALVVSTRFLTARPGKGRTLPAVTHFAEEIYCSDSSECRAGVSDAGMRSYLPFRRLVAANDKWIRGKEPKHIRSIYWAAYSAEMSTVASTRTWTSNIVG